jgi:hypothetical protein
MHTIFPSKVRAVRNEGFKIAGITGLVREQPLKAVTVLDGYTATSVLLIDCKSHGVILLKCRAATTESLSRGGTLQR